MKPTLNAYVSRRLDGVQGEIPRLIHMFKKAFSMANFRLFWNIWNPIYSYILTYYVYKPLRIVLPKPLSLVLTFIVNGLFHDLVVFILLGHSRFVISKLFLIYAMLVVLESILKIRLPEHKLIRLLYNLSLLLVPVLIVI